MKKNNFPRVMQHLCAHLLGECQTHRLGKTKNSHGSNDPASCNMMALCEKTTRLMLQKLI